MERSEGVDALQTLIQCADPLDAYAQLERRWPGRGWDIEAHKLRQMRATIAAARPKSDRLLATEEQNRPKRGPLTINRREFADVHEKAEFYRKLFADGIGAIHESPMNES